MQQIDRILKVDGGGGTWCDDWGKSSLAPEIMIGVRAKLVIDLRSSSADSITGILDPFVFDFEHDSCYFVLDADYDQATIPKMLKTDGITISSDDTGTWLTAELPNTATTELMEALATAQTITLNGEIGLYIAEEGVASVDFAVQFTVTIRNRVWIGGEVPEDVTSDSEYLTAAEVKALIAEATKAEKGDTGDDGEDGEDGASAYEIAVSGGYVGTESEWIASLKGDTGASAYEIAVAGGYTGTIAEWLISLKGDTGLNAYEIAVVNGYSGSVNDWLEDLKGETGKDLRLDATGSTLTDLDLYSEKSAGFTFGATVTDATAKTTKLYIYAKKSDALNDWCDPLVITYYSADAAVLLEPFEMGEKDGGWFEFTMPNNCAHIANVCIDTSEGEVVLPLNSSNGVTKIIKNKTTNKVRIHFGSNVEEFTSGRVYFSQGWASASIDTAVIEKPQIYYGYLDNGVYDCSDVTSIMLEELSTAKTELTKQSLGMGNAGDLLVVLIPSSSDWVAKKFDGIASAVPFDENVGQAGTGANGEAVTLNGVSYRIYGEFIITAGERFIYVQ